MVHGSVVTLKRSYVQWKPKDTFFYGKDKMAKKLMVLVHQKKKVLHIFASYTMTTNLPFLILLILYRYKRVI